MNIQQISGIFYWGFVSRAQKELNEKYQFHMSCKIKKLLQKTLPTSNELQIRKASTHNRWIAVLGDSPFLDKGIILLSSAGFPRKLTRQPLAENCLDILINREGTWAGFSVKKEEVKETTLFKCRWNWFCLPHRVLTPPPPRREDR